MGQGIRLNIQLATITLEKVSSRASADMDCPVVSSIQMFSLLCCDWPSKLVSFEARILVSSFRLYSESRSTIFSSP